jgi:hypothetical protein
MNLAKRDQLIQSLKTQKKRKEHFLNERSAHLKTQSKTNPHLNAVAEDYALYVASINDEKTQQTNALQVLVEYLNQLILDPNSTSEIIKQAKYDQGIILAELKNNLLKTTF